MMRLVRFLGQWLWLSALLTVFFLSPPLVGLGLWATVAAPGLWVPALITSVSLGLGFAALLEAIKS